MIKLLVILVGLIASPTLAASPVPSDGVISSSGEYNLAADRTTTGMFNIQINTTSVSLDLNGKTVRCNPADPATAVTLGGSSGAFA